MSNETTSRRPVGRETVRSYIDEMGPAWIAGAIAAGPATMGSLLSAGAGFGFTLLWVVIASAGAGALSQFLAMRLGLLTERGIVSVVEEHLGEGWAWLLVADAVLAAGVAQLVIMKTVTGVSATMTGIDAGIWGVVWGVVLAAGLATRGYRFLEVGAKLLVSLVVLAFLASLFVVPIDPGAAAAGLVPSLPSGSAVLAAGIVGGAVHITLITMHSYTMRARGWTERDSGLATVDIGISMGVVFGAYSLAIFFVAASVLTSTDLTTIGAAQALGPIAGDSAQWLFLIGLAGAAVSTLGGNTIVPPFLIADKLDWGTDIDDTRYRALLVVVALLSIPGAFIPGNVIGQLVLILAVGTLGTPFAVAIVLYLLNTDAVSQPNSLVLNLGGGVLLLVTGVLAANFVREQVAAGIELLSGFVLIFGAAIALATLVLTGKYVREEILTA